ncbi:hypothetical protein OAK75_00840 [Bacteriovoracales bacterium]|nr:hypothetical protein [Bacteriovoracales bacterium]
MLRFIIDKQNYWKYFFLIFLLAQYAYAGSWNSIGDFDSTIDELENDPSTKAFMLIGASHGKPPPETPLESISGQGFFVSDQTKKDIIEKYGLCEWLYVDRISTRYEEGEILGWSGSNPLFQRQPGMIYWKLKNVYGLYNFGAPVSALEDEDENEANKYLIGPEGIELHKYDEQGELLTPPRISYSDGDGNEKKLPISENEINPLSNHSHGAVIIKWKDKQCLFTKKDTSIFETGAGNEYCRPNQPIMSQKITLQLNDSNVNNNSGRIAVCFEVRFLEEDIFPEKNKKIENKIKQLEVVAKNLMEKNFHNDVFYNVAIKALKEKVKADPRYNRIIRKIKCDYYNICH